MNDNMDPTTKYHKAAILFLEFIESNSKGRFPQSQP